jgi:2-amino-4-hydroxy-6-hydroxymethyldihydropteridine diphosphokinase
MAKTSYAIALGSNRRHGRHGSPAAVVGAAVEALKARGLKIERVSKIRATAALGPAGRGFANAAIVLSTPLEPPDLLSELKSVEREFGRRRGRRWGPRVLDLDILLWSEGSWEGPGLIVPHPGFRDRKFVLEPLAEIAPGWRDPVTGATVRQLLFRHLLPVAQDRPQVIRTRTGPG